jgi:hypothetical protein
LVDWRPDSYRDGKLANYCTMKVVRNTVLRGGIDK